jgi:hypothetical protein
VVKCIFRLNLFFKNNLRISTEDDQIILGDVNIREMKNEIEDLKDIVKEQQEMLITLWHHPGMPGYQEAKDQYESDIKL